MTELDQARQKINHINQQLVNLLEERFNAVNQVNQYKEQHQLPILDTEREQNILHAIQGLIEDSTKTPFITAIFQEIMNQSRQYEQTLRKED